MYNILSFFYVKDAIERKERRKGTCHLANITWPPFLILFELGYFSR